MAQEDANKPNSRDRLSAERGRLWREVRNFARRNQSALLVGAFVGIGGIGYLLGDWQHDNEFRRLTYALSEKKSEGDQLRGSLNSTLERLEVADREKMRAVQTLGQMQPSIDELPHIKADLAKKEEEVRGLQASLDQVNRLLSASEIDRKRLQLALGEANKLLRASEEEQKKLASQCGGKPPRQ
jgi:hypothetical protein